MTSRRTAAALAVVTTVTAGAFGLTLLPGASPVASATGLTPYDDCTQLLSAYRGRLVKTATAWPRYGYYLEDGVGLATAGGAPVASSRDAAAAPQSAGKAAVGTSGTGTNVQEAGVDEPDTVKLAGDVLVVSWANSLQLVRPSRTPELLGTVSLGPDAGEAQLLVDGTRVLALTQRWRDDTSASGKSSDLRVMPYGGGAPQTVATLVDIADPRAPKVIETSTTDGRLVSARLAEGRVRLVLSSAARPETVPPVYDGNSLSTERRTLLANRRLAAATPLSRVLPQRERRTADGVLLERTQAVACGDVSYPEGAAGTSTLTLTTLDLQASLAPTGTEGVNADGDLVYATSGTVYVATSRWGTTAAVADAAVPQAEVSTQIHAFALTPRSADYTASGSVPGYLLNSYSLSEHEGHLRVVTTRQPPWDSGGAASGTSASLLVLRDDGAGALDTVGRVDGLGKGERVFAVRFLGELATVVTFRQTDPLYTLDLSVPTAPRVLGELKIPGFSNYLHPIGGDTLLGIGNDASLEGRVTGMQLATFDLSDLRAPRRADVLGLGPAWSEAMHDPHAFTYSPERSLALLPVSQGPNPVLLGVRATPDGLTEVGRLADASGRQVRRGMVVGDLVVAVADGSITVGTTALHRTGSVRLSP